MSINKTLTGFAGKYGPHSKLIASSVLNVIAPGSGALISITETAIEAAKDISDDIDHAEWEERLMAKVNQGQAEIKRLSQLIEMLNGPLAKVCEKAETFVDDPEQLMGVVGRAIATDPSLAQTLHEVQLLKTQFEVFQRDLRLIARNQEQVMPVYDRMNRVADYFDELWQAGIKPQEFVQSIAAHRSASNQIQHGNTKHVEEVIDKLREATPNSPTVCVLEAAAASREFNYLSAQKALSKAVKLLPDDRELKDIANQVTVMATQTSKRPRSTTTNKSERRLQPGDTLDGWVLESRRGAGGWGQVFKAKKGSETKAIKVMHPELAADPVFLERFKKEIASLWGLPKHPNLIRIDRPETSFGFCMDHQTWYLAMEYIDGPTLESYLAAKGALSEGHIIRVFGPLVEGLAAAHKSEVVHRDIKPSNMIFRRSDQRLVLVDFGLAVGVDDFGETKVGGISIQFAAPEQHYGGSATKASDVFSMCSVMHYALNYHDKDNRAPHAFSSANAPKSLRQALTQGMQMAPGQRTTDASQLLGDLSSANVPRVVKNKEPSVESPSRQEQEVSKAEAPASVKSKPRPESKKQENIQNQSKLHSKDLNPPKAQRKNRSDSDLNSPQPVKELKSGASPETPAAPDKSVKADLPKAKRPSAQPASSPRKPVPPIKPENAGLETTATLEQLEKPKPGSKRLLVKSAIAMLILAGLGVGGYFAYGSIVDARNEAESIRKLQTIRPYTHTTIATMPFRQAIRIQMEMTGIAGDSWCTKPMWKEIL